MGAEGSKDWLWRRNLEIVPSGPVQGALQAPSSKSLTNRLLVIAALAEGTSVLRRMLVSDDTVAMTRALRQLGAQIETSGDTTVIVGTCGQPGGNGATLDAGLSGTTLRFLSAVGLLAKGTVVLDGHEPLRRRPIGPLIEALRSAGAKVLTDNGRPPLRISGRGFPGGFVAVDATSSSQFATALLLVGPYGDDDLVLEVRGLDELGYVRLSVDVMTRWGAVVSEESPGHFKVSSEARYLAREETVEHDASAAAHLYAIAAAAGGSITVTNGIKTAQPDGGVLEVMSSMGARFVRHEGGTTLERRGELVGVEVDLGAMPDQLPTFAALGAVARGDTVIRGVTIARGHESDRISAVVTELSRLGAVVEELADGLVVHGGALLHGGLVRTYQDHRIAMAFTAIGAVVPGVQISDPGCVAKTYPEFFDDVVKLGVGIRSGD